MSTLCVHGGNRLSGEITVYGAKNAVLPILAASIMTKERVVLKGCPRLSDVHHMIEILQSLGTVVQMDGDVIYIDPMHTDSHEMPEELFKKLRSSIVLLGALLSRFKRAWVTQPGGCDIGLRPIDLHIKGLRDLNVEIVEAHGALQCTGLNTQGAELQLDYPSVGATENIMMAAAMAKGKSVIHNAAREPEIADLARFINAMGGRIHGAGTDCITIYGVDELHGTTYNIMFDRIVAGTYMAATAITGGDVLIKNVVPANLRAAAGKLREAGCELDFAEDSLRVKAPKRLTVIKRIETLPYPGFPTDLQAQWMALASVADGTGVIMENVFESRFKHAAELCRMGADITIKDRMAVIRGVEQLQGIPVIAEDLRGGAALVLAGLAAKGVTFVKGEQHVDRGYEDLAYELGSIGADITRREERDAGSTVQDGA